MGKKLLGDFLGERRRCEVRTIRQNDDREIFSRKPLDHGAKTYRGAGVPHAGMAFVGVQKPAKAVGDRLAWSEVVAVAVFGPMRLAAVGERDRRKSTQHLLLAEQCVFLKRFVPLPEIRHIRIDSAVPERRGSGTLIGLDKCILFLRVAQCPPVHLVHALLIDNRVIHAHRREDLLIEKFAVRHPRNFGKDQAQNHIAGIAVIPARAGSKFSRGLLLEQG